MVALPTKQPPERDAEQVSDVGLTGMAARTCETKLSQKGET